MARLALGGLAGGKDMRKKYAKKPVGMISKKGHKKKGRTKKTLPMYSQRYYVALQIESSYI